jgi:hypothetical protein
MYLNLEPNNVSSATALALGPCSNSGSIKRDYRRGHGDHVNLCMPELIRHKEIGGAQLQDCALYETWHGLFELSIAA